MLIRTFIKDPLTSPHYINILTTPQTEKHEEKYNILIILVLTQFLKLYPNSIKLILLTIFRILDSHEHTNYYRLY